MERRLKILCLACFLAGWGAASARAAADFNEATRLAALAKAWGLLKYYHPVVAQGTLYWDEELIYVIPSAASAASGEELDNVFRTLIRRAGEINFLNFPQPFPKNHQEDPLFVWLNDPDHFKWYTRLQLECLIANFVPVPNKYCSYAFPEGNLNFFGEVSYDAPAYPDEGHRLVALFRYWNAIHYFYPYKHLIGGDWEMILGEFIPKVRGARNALEYHLAIRELTARINDGHAVTKSQVLSEFWGMYRHPFECRLVEGRTVVTRIYTHLPASAGDLRIGDIVLRADGISVEAIRAEKAKYVHGSNDPGRQKYLDSYIFWGSTDRLRLTVSREGREADIDVVRCHSDDYKAPPVSVLVWTILSGNIGYVDMGILEVVQVETMMKDLAGTKGIIFDIRNYPRGTYDAIAKHLNPEGRPYCRVSYPNLNSPGHFSWRGPYKAGPNPPRTDYYKGRVVLLVDERTQSHAELTTMALRTAPRAVVIGSPTAGANGNISILMLPGGISTWFSGLGFTHPDGRDMQRTGIVPDIAVKPTIRGIRERRDEVLEAALDYLNKGTSAPAR